ncbi:MAG: hypothetical protein ACM3S2_11080 [Ignavibacteriales bacterium]
MNLNSTFTRFFVGWYALFQVAHLTFLFRALEMLIRFGVFVFPASPPAEGWNSQAGNFLIGMAIFDTLNILVSIVFFYGFFAHAKWRLFVGLLNLAVMMYSALVFAYGTIASGAWGQHILEYIGMTIAFLPIVVLFISFLVQAFKGRFYESHGESTSFY